MTSENEKKIKVAENKEGFKIEDQIFIKITDETYLRTFVADEILNEDKAYAHDSRNNSFRVISKLDKEPWLVCFHPSSYDPIALPMFKLESIINEHNTKKSK